MIDRKVVDGLPSAPGVYLMKGSKGEILYVGKAKDLRKRVRAYLDPARDSRWQIRFLMERVTGLDFTVTDTEKEALILENTLIKLHRPRYNFNLRDDKTYFSLRLDPAEEFPRLTVVRRVARDGARYFGPYSSASAAREVIRELGRLFPLRRYPLESCRRRPRPCLFYQIRQCSGPCHGLITPGEYGELVAGTVLFLEGKSRALLRLYRQRMTAASEQARFEEAARYRDRIRAIEVTLEKQKVVAGHGDRDVLGIWREGENLELGLLFIRGGSLIGSRTFAAAWELEDAEVVATFLNEFYNREVQVPEEIVLPVAIADPGPLAELLAERRGGKVAIVVPHRGVKTELVRMAARNAELAAAERRRREEGAEAVLAELQEKLHLERPPRRIECYDISNIQGEQAVGSGVVFVNGRPATAAYRHYRIKTVTGSDDFAMMREVLSRRFREGSTAGPPPDLILVDGGPGQLSVLCAVLRELGIDGVSAASLAKSRVEKGMGKDETVSRSDERVFLPGRKNPVTLRQSSAPLLLLARLRDEAHRFAITYHRKLRGKATLRTALTDIPGIGEKRRKELLRRFGSLQRVREATVEELAAVKGIGAKGAEKLWRELHPEGMDGRAT